MDALNRADGAQASQLWLEMRVPDRSNLSHNIGFKNEVSQADIGRALLTQHQEQAAKNGDDRDIDIADGHSESQQTERPGRAGDPSAASLSNLPALNAMQQSEPATTVPAH